MKSWFVRLVFHKSISTWALRLTVACREGRTKCDMYRKTTVGSPAGLLLLMKIWDVVLWEGPFSRGGRGRTCGPPSVVATIARVAQVLPYKSPWNLAPISLLFLSRMTCLPIAEETAQAAAGHSPFQFLFEFLDPSFHLSFRLLCCFKLTFQHLLLPGELVYLCN